MEEQTLAGTLARGPLPVGTALNYASQIARELRDLHAAGGVHGHLSAFTILIGASGALLAPSLAYPGEHAAQRDVEAWGGVLLELLGGVAGVREAAGGSGRGPEGVLPNAFRLAARCRVRPPGRLLTMQQVYNEIRLLSVLARQYGLDQPAVAPPAPPSLSPTEESRRGWAISLWPRRP